MITSIKHTLQPYYKQNMNYAGHHGSTTSVAIPNIEILAFPVSNAVRHETLTALTGPQFDEWANEQQRKSSKMMPSGPRSWFSKRPRVTTYTGPSTKEGGTAMLGMGAPHWYSCDPDPLVAGGVDQTVYLAICVLLILFTGCCPLLNRSRRPPRGRPPVQHPRHREHRNFLHGVPYADHSRVSHAQGRVTLTIPLRPNTVGPGLARAMYITLNTVYQS